MTELVACNHFRGALYFKESINSALPFNAYPCKSYEDFAKGRCTGCPTGGCPHMGYDAVKQKGKAGGSFYLKTNKIEPFRGKFLIGIHQHYVVRKRYIHDIKIKSESFDPLSN